ncbi:MobC family plasmid mobilization relaxosome protein [Enterococcus faecium]|uniref:plasmid mobilization protein n=1 Tax=Enterococcus TaxID=1350 RepID=UPI00209050E1|nr:MULTISPECIES: plasmid mobilization relaxosome protein MobC [Enterococcus]MCO5532764.1 MobC family plasmid mobilization relaxosome protein [Enterococcus faecium]MDT2486295.1 plasmid mobilization relaxosome protein MobC [Enterococcus avium]MDT2517444.1 plasmid mobilization relaxosome protein MobC [Enterococcus avium]
MWKEENRTRNIPKKFWINEPEQKAIEKNMQKAKIKNFGLYVRKCCLNKKIYVADISSFEEIISVIAQANFEMNRIGNNLNQIAKYLNESEQNQTKELMKNYQNELKALQIKLKSVLKKFSEG